MGNPNQGLKGRGPTGVGATNPNDGRHQVVIGDAAPDAKTTAPKTTRYQSVWLGWAHGKPAIFEYEPDYHWLWGKQIDKPYHRLTELSYKPREKRGWYEEGDLILHTTVPEWLLIQTFPELSVLKDEDESVLTELVLGFLLGPPEQYTYAWKIVSIAPHSEGRGLVVLEPILKLDDKTFIQLEKIVKRSQRDLNNGWALSVSMRALGNVVNAFGTAFYEASFAVATGGVSSLARGGVRGVALFTLQVARRRVASRVLARKIFVTLSRDVSKATLAATMEFLTVFGKTYKKEAKKQDMADASGTRYDGQAYNVALTKAAGAFVGKFISSLLNMRLDKLLRNSAYGTIEKEFTKRVIQAFATTIPEGFIKALAGASAAEQQHPGTFEEALAKEMLNEMVARFKSLVNIDLKPVAEQIMKN